MGNITINDILYVLLTAAVPLVLRYLYQLVSAKVSDTEAKRAVDAVYAAVEYVNQRFVDSLKKSGSFDKEAQQHAFEQAKDAAMLIMEDSTRRWLEKSIKDLDGWMTVQIESAVKAVKV